MLFKTAGFVFTLQVSPWNLSLVSAWFLFCLFSQAKVPCSFSTAAQCTDNQLPVPRLWTAGKLQSTNKLLCGSPQLCLCCSDPCLCSTNGLTLMLWCVIFRTPRSFYAVSWTRCTKNSNNLLYHSSQKVFHQMSLKNQITIMLKGYWEEQTCPQTVWRKVREVWMKLSITY